MRTPPGQRAKAGLDVLAWAHSGGGEAGETRAAIERLLEHAPDEVRAKVLAGMHALYAWELQTRGR